MEGPETVDEKGKVPPEAVLETLGEKAGLEGDEVKTLGSIGRQTARFNKFVKYALTLPQIERENAHIPGVTDFVEGVRNWWGEKGRWLEMAQDTMQYARKLGITGRKQETKSFEKFL